MDADERYRVAGVAINSSAAKEMPQDTCSEEIRVGCEIEQGSTTPNYDVFNASRSEARCLRGVFEIG